MSSFFYFFSEEPDWVRDELIPQLYLTEGNCKIVDINGSDKGLSLIHISGWSGFAGALGPLYSTCKRNRLFGSFQMMI